MQAQQASCGAGSEASVAWFLLALLVYSEKGEATREARGAQQSFRPTLLNHVSVRARLKIRAVASLTPGRAQREPQGYAGLTSPLGWLNGFVGRCFDG